MRIYDGKHMDKTDEKSDEYIKINSAGIQNLSSSCTVIREDGRKDYHILLLIKGNCNCCRFHFGFSFHIVKPCPSSEVARLGLLRTVRPLL